MYGMSRRVLRVVWLEFMVTSGSGRFSWPDTPDNEFNAKNPQALYPRDDCRINAHAVLGGSEM